MQINITQVLKQYDGKDITEPERVTEKVKNPDGKEREVINTVQTPLTLRTLLVAALQRNDPAKLLTAEDQAKVHQLCLKIYEKNDISLTSKEKSFIEEKVSKIGNPLYYGRVLEIFGDLDGVTDKTVEAKGNDTPVN